MPISCSQLSALLKLRIPVRDAQKPSLLNQTELSWGKTSVKLQTALNPQLLRPKLSNLHQTVHREIQQFSRYYSKLCKFTEVKTLNQLQNCAQRPEIVIQHPEYYLYQHKLVLPFFARLRYRVLTSPSKVKSVIQWVKMPINVQLNSNLLNFVCSCKNFPKMQRNWQTTLLSFSAASGTGVIKRKKGGCTCEMGEPMRDCDDAWLCVMVLCAVFPGEARLPGKTTFSVCTI